MAFKSLDHKDETLFKNRLWKLMSEKGHKTPKQLAQALCKEGIILVESTSKDELVIIESMARRIQEHLTQDDTDKLQSKYVRAYCEYFNCSADYLFGFTKIKNSDADIRRFCEITGLSEIAVSRLGKELPTELSTEDREFLVGFWSKILESNLFYGVPIEFQQLCYELSQQRGAEKKLSCINIAAGKISNSDIYGQAISNMMKENYRKLIAPHEAAALMHRSIIMRNIEEYLEKWAEEYCPIYEKKMHIY